MSAPLLVPPQAVPNLTSYRCRSIGNWGRDFCPPVLKVKPSARSLREGPKKIFNGLRPAAFISGAAAACSGLSQLSSWPTSPARAIGESGAMYFGAYSIGGGFDVAQLRVVPAAYTRADKGWHNQSSAFSCKPDKEIEIFEPT